MTNPLNKARELGDSIVSSEEYKQLKQCELNLQNSEESLSLYQSMDNSIEDRDKAMEDRLVAELIQAQGNFNKLMRDINTIVSYYTGYLAEKGNCGSCGGCK